MTNITIYLDPAVRAFIVHRYGDDDGQVRIERRTMLGTVIEGVSEKIGFRHYLPKSEVPTGLSPLTLTLSRAMKSTFIVPPKLRVLEKYFRYVFRESLITSVAAQVAIGVSDYDAVDFWMDCHGISEDMIAADTLRKMWRDYQKSRAEKLMKKS